MNVIGQRVLRLEDPRFLRGEGRYVDNLRLENALHATFVRSPFAHATIRNVDVGDAAALPGVQVLTAADVDLTVMPQPPFLVGIEAMARPFIASERVRFVGDIVAVVLSEDSASGEDAAELVAVDYDPLPVLTDSREAVRDETLLFPAQGTNVCFRVPPQEPDPALFDGCDVVVSGTLVSQRMAASPLEPRATAAVVGDDGRLTVWLSTQTPHMDHAGIAGVLGLDPGQVHVVAPDVGGGFGAKGLNVEDVLIAWLARHTGRPVRWVETRSENMVAMNQGRAQVINWTLGGSSEGEVQAYRVEILQDAGAYPALAPILGTLTALMASGVYAIPKIEADVTSVVTNTTPVGAFRGAGRPEATQTIERAMSAFADELGADPAEVRRRNLIPKDAFPYTTASGAPYDIGDYERALDVALETVGYKELRAEQQRRRDAGDVKQLGIGLSTYVEVTNGLGETEFGAVEMQPDGSAILRTGSFSHGQGHETTFAMIVSERLGIPVEKVTVLKGDTDEVPRGTGTYGSKSTQIGGAAASEAAVAVAERAKAMAAELLEVSADDVVLDLGAGRFHVAGAPQTGLTWGELASRAEADGRLGELKVEEDFQAATPTFPFGAHIAVVEVDTETGQVELQRIVAVDDAGTIISPIVAEGQVQGGLATGISQALFEEVVYDADGNPVTASFAGYGFPSAAELPDFEVIEMETPTPINPLGAKGIGESGTIGVTPAVQNAVIDALRPYGVHDIDMPANGERVWRALREAKGEA